MINACIYEGLAENLLSNTSRRNIFKKLSMKVLRVNSCVDIGDFFESNHIISKIFIQFNWITSSVVQLNAN